MGRASHLRTLAELGAHLRQLVTATPDHPRAHFTRREAKALEWAVEQLAGHAAGAGLLAEATATKQRHAAKRAARVAAGTARPAPYVVLDRLRALFVDHDLHAHPADTDDYRLLVRIDEQLSAWFDSTPPEQRR